MYKVHLYIHIYYILITTVGNYTVEALKKTIQKIKLYSNYGNYKKHSAATTAWICLRFLPSKKSIHFFSTYIEYYRWRYQAQICRTIPFKIVAHPYMLLLHDASP